MSDKVNLVRLSTGVPGLDNLLGGGLTEFSFSLISGAPGTGKTTLAHQIMFSLASPERKALFFTVLGEPPLKMLRYQQQFPFFDIEKVGASVRYVNLADSLREGDFSGVLERIAKEVEAFSPSLVFVDSFRSVMQTARSGNEGLSDLQQFVQELGTRMTSWQATTFLIGEYVHTEIEAHPILTVADGHISLTQTVERNSVLRKIQVVKMRGAGHMTGLHVFRMTDDGIQIFPRLLPTLGEKHELVPADRDPPRISMGIPRLDDMLCGGLPRGYSIMVTGPSGSGKTILGTAFLSEGARLGEKGVVALFEKGTARLRNAVLGRLVREGHVTIVESRTLDLSIEEILDDLMHAIRRTNAKRVVVDSLSEIGLYLAPEFREDIRAAVFRLLCELAQGGVSVVVTTGLDDRFAEMSFSRFENAFLSDAIISMHYVETRGEIAKVLAVAKVRGSDHSKDLRRYEITEGGIEIGEKMSRYEGLLSGHPTVVDDLKGGP
jgi:circadian clock protein KaiC